MYTQAARAYDKLARQFGATAAQLNFPSSPEKLRASAEACGAGVGGEVSRSLSSAFTDFAQRTAAASAPQGSQASGGAQQAVSENAVHTMDEWVCEAMLLCLNP